MKAQMKPQDPVVATGTPLSEDEVDKAIAEIRWIVSRIDRLHWKKYNTGALGDIPVQNFYVAKYDENTPERQEIKQRVDWVQELRAQILPTLEERMRPINRGCVVDEQGAVIKSLNDFACGTEVLSFNSLRRFCARHLGARHYSEVALCYRNGFKLPRGGVLKDLEMLPLLELKDGTNSKIVLRKEMIPSSLTVNLQAEWREDTALGIKLRVLNSEEWYQDISKAIAFGDEEMIRRMWPVVRPHDQEKLRKTLRRAMSSFLRSCYGAYPDTCRALLADLVQVCGVDIGSTRATLQTLLHEIARPPNQSLSTKKIVSLVRALQEHGLNIFAVDEMGMSALHYAVNSRDMVCGLLLCGLDKDQQNLASKRPLDIFNETYIQKEHVPFGAEIEKLLKGENSERANLGAWLLRSAFRSLA